ncbi:hypothetical protein ACS3SW_10790 [Roseobacteraceae bacterium S113]
MKYILIAAFMLGLSSMAQATPLNSWKTSCSVDSGSIQKKRGVYTFKTSTNRCPGGTFNQRAELTSKKVSPKIEGAYLFEANVAMVSNDSEQFDIFQIHDGRDGCAPPLKVQVAPNGTIRLQSAVKLGPGEQCKPEDRTVGDPNVRIRRDGTEYNLRVLIQFNGAGEFLTNVWVDGKLAVAGAYRRPDIPGAFKSKNFYFKHGVYSKNMFDYQMTSAGMKVKKVKVSK